jgi:hypothetical protein
LVLFEVPSGDEKAITKILGLSTIADFAAHFCNYLASVGWHSGVRRSNVMEKVRHWLTGASSSAGSLVVFLCA